MASALPNWLEMLQVWTTVLVGWEEPAFPSRQAHPGLSRQGLRPAGQLEPATPPARAPPAARNCPTVPDGGWHERDRGGAARRLPAPGERLGGHALAVGYHRKSAADPRFLRHLST